MKNLPTFENFLLENKEEQFLVNIEFRVSLNFFHTPLEILKTTLHFKCNKLLYSYEIKSQEEDHKKNEFVATATLYSKKNRSETLKYLIDNTSSLVTYRIIK
jgi:hypothetical protein